ncbi:uncharacterized protein [Miscanthus floridulus]|uniref:uncharacterized protein n=1 Tax=Miscanthus floridulus TaxID=154761 RepID=UPI0034574157
MVATKSKEGESPPGNDDEDFTVELHHGGLFVGQGQNRAYVDEKISWFDQCDVNTWSPLWLEDFILQLHYPKTPSTKMHWLLPGLSLSEGLRMVESTSDTLVMASLVHKVKTFVVYVDHDGTLDGFNLDDIVANPIASLPKVMTPPKKPHFVDSNKERPTVDDEEKDNDGGNSGSDDDSDFKDLDYELEEDDDDVFVQRVDDQVTDEGVGKGKVITLGKRGNKGKLPDCDDDVSKDDEELQLPDSDGEGEGNLRFRSFKEKDLRNPIFKVGMLFESVELLRKAVTEYNIKERVQIHYSRNEQKRLKAHCEEGCPWMLYGSIDSRAHGMVLKTYNGTHTCQKKWKVKRLTSRWLANKYVESFRADQKMTLVNFSRIV